MFKWDLNIKKYEYGFIFKNSELIEMVKVVKSQHKKSKGWLWTLKVQIWSAIYLNVIWSLKKWMQNYAQEVDIIQDRQDLKKSNRWLLVWKAKLLLWPNDHFALWPKLMRKFNILLDNPTNPIGLGVVI